MCQWVRILVVNSQEIRGDFIQKVLEISISSMTTISWTFDGALTSRHAMWYSMVPVNNLLSVCGHTLPFETCHFNVYNGSSVRMWVNVFVCFVSVCWPFIRSSFICFMVILCFGSVFFRLPSSSRVFYCFLLHDWNISKSFVPNYVMPMAISSETACVNIRFIVRFSANLFLLTLFALCESERWQNTHFDVVAFDIFSLYNLMGKKRRLNNLFWWNFTMWSMMVEQEYAVWKINEKTSWMFIRCFIQSNYKGNICYQPYEMYTYLHRFERYLSVGSAEKHANHSIHMHEMFESFIDPCIYLFYEWLTKRKATHIKSQRKCFELAD